MVSSFFGILTKGTVRAWNITYFKFDFFGKKNRVNEIGFAIIFYGQQKGFWKALFYVVSISAFLFFVFSCYDLRASFHATIYALPWPGAVQRHRDHSQHNQREIRGARSGSLLRSRRALRDIPKKTAAEETNDEEAGCNIVRRAHGIVNYTSAFCSLIGCIFYGLV